LQLYLKGYNCFHGYGAIHPIHLKCFTYTRRILGEGYSLDDEEDMAIKQVTKLRVYQAPMLKCYMLDLFAM